MQPGQTASYAIWVWATGGSVTAADVQIRGSEATDVSGPSFTVCPSGGGQACSVGGLSSSQSEELVAGISVGSQAPGGDHVVLTATASAAGAGSGSASAVVEVVTPTAADPTGYLDSTALELGSAGGDFPPLVNLPGVTPINPTTLFPTVSPASSSGSGVNSQAGGARHIDATTTAAVIPLPSVLLSGQLVGLAVLGGAIALCFVRFSLRVRAPDSSRKPR